MALAPRPSSSIGLPGDRPQPRLAQVDVAQGRERHGEHDPPRGRLDGRATGGERQPHPAVGEGAHGGEPVVGAHGADRQLGDHPGDELVVATVHRVLLVGTVDRRQRVLAVPAEQVDVVERRLLAGVEPVLRHGVALHQLREPAGQATGHVGGQPLVDRHVVERPAGRGPRVVGLRVGRGLECVLHGQPDLPPVGVGRVVGVVAHRRSSTCRPSRRSCRR